MLTILIRSLILVSVAVFTFRLMGKRQVGQLQLPDHEGVAFTGKINEPYLTLLSEFFPYANDWKEYKSMSYVFYDKETREYFASEEYDLVYFNTQRAE